MGSERYTHLLKMKSAVCDDNDHDSCSGNSTNTTTLPERRLWNRVLVHVITRKKDGLR
jgi:hypothetical protein